MVRLWDTDLKGSNAGRFLMGAGNTLRWTEHAGLRAMLNAVVDGVESCRNVSDGMRGYQNAVRCSAKWRWAVCSLASKNRCSCRPAARLYVRAG